MLLKQLNFSAPLLFLIEGGFTHAVIKTYLKCLTFINVTCKCLTFGTSKTLETFEHFAITKC